MSDDEKSNVTNEDKTTDDVKVEEEMSEETAEEAKDTAEEVGTEEETTKEAKDTAEEETTKEAKEDLAEAETEEETAEKVTAGEVEAEEVTTDEAKTKEETAEEVTAAEVEAAEVEAEEETAGEVEAEEETSGEVNAGEIETAEEVQATEVEAEEETAGEVEAEEETSGEVNAGEIEAEEETAEEVQATEVEAEEETAGEVEAEEETAGEVEAEEETAGEVEAEEETAEEVEAEEETAGEVEAEEETAGEVEAEEETAEEVQAGEVEAEEVNTGEVEAEEETAEEVQVEEEKYEEKVEENAEEPDRDEYLLVFFYSSINGLIISKYDVDKAEWFGQFSSDDLKTKEFVTKHGNTVYLMENDELYTLDLTTKAIEKYECKDVPTRVFAAPLIGDSIYFITESGGIYNLDTNDRKINKCADLNYAGKTLATTTVVVDGMLYIFPRSDELAWAFNPETNELRPIAPFPVPTKSRSKIQIMDISDFKGYDPVGDYRRSPCQTCHFSMYMFYTDKFTLKVTGLDCPFVIPTEYNGKVYAVENNSNRYLYEYSPENDQWNIIRVKCPFQVLINTQIAIHNEKMYCIAGNAVAQYDFENNQWETKRANTNTGWLVERIFSIHKNEI